MSFEEKGGSQLLRTWFFISLSVLLRKVLLFKLYSCVIWVHVINLLSRDDRVAGGANSNALNLFILSQMLLFFLATIFISSLATTSSFNRIKSDHHWKLWSLITFVWAIRYSLIWHQSLIIMWNSHWAKYSLYSTFCA